METLHFATLSQIKNIITAISHRFKKIDKRIDSLPEWAKQSTKPTYTAEEVGALPDDTKIPTKVSDLQNDSDFISVETDPTVPQWAKQSNKPTYTATEVGALPSDTHIPTKTSDLTNDSGFITGYTETDPTVPSWAKQQTKPTYTAQEVGALPSDTVIPNKTSQLQNDSGYATQEYVDDNIGRAGILVVNITDGEKEGTYESDKTFVEISEAITEGKDIKCIYWNNIYHLVYNNNDGFLQFQNRINIDVDDPQYSDINDIHFNVIQIDIFNNTIDVFQDRCEVPLPSITTPLMNGTSSIGNSKKYAKADHVHPTDTTRAAVNDVLIKTNTTSYTPTADYHPATKKYVDDATSGITSNLSGLTDTTITTPTDGQLLKYNATTSKWENSSISKEVMIITITSTGSGNNITYSADKTYSEISTHINNGGIPIVFYLGNCYHLEYFDSDEEEMCFSYISSNGLVIFTQKFVIFPSGIGYSEPTTQRLDVSLGISGNVIQLKNGDNTVMSSITLPVYNGGVS